jgi:hypothetical protein
LKGKREIGEAEEREREIRSLPFSCIHCFTKLFKKNNFSSTIALNNFTFMAEPPELNGSHVPVIVLPLTGAHISHIIPVVCLVSSGNPESSTFYNSYRINNGVATTLQHLLQKITYIGVWKSYNICLQNIFK